MPEPKTTPGNIYRVGDGSRFEAVVGQPGDGASPHGAIVDEYHQHRTTALYDAMKTGMGSRAQPMLWVITTAGTDTSGPCFAHHESCVKVLEGVFRDDALFVLIYTVDDDQDWQKYNTWKQVNPNYGVSVYEHYLKSQHQTALQLVEKQNVLRCKHLNQWMNAGVGWMNMVQWAAGARPGMDWELAKDDFRAALCMWLGLSPDELRAARAYLGLDLASKIDIASLVVLIEFGQGAAVFARHYLPADTINQPHNTHYRQWREQGHLTQIPGARNDFHQIEDDIKALSEVLSLQELAYDPREAEYPMQHIREWASFPCIDVPQSPTHISEPMKEVEAMVAGGELTHPDDPVLNWMFSNVVQKTAKSGGPVKYQYPTKNSTRNKIDGAVAMIMAASRFMKDEDHSEGDVGMEIWD